MRKYWSLLMEWNSKDTQMLPAGSSSLAHIVIQRGKFEESESSLVRTTPVNYTTVRTVTVEGLAIQAQDWNDGIALNSAYRSWKVRTDEGLDCREGLLIFILDKPGLVVIRLSWSVYTVTNIINLCHSLQKDLSSFGWFTDTGSCMYVTYCVGQKMFIMALLMYTTTKLLLVLTVGINWWWNGFCYQLLTLLGLIMLS